MNNQGIIDQIKEKKIKYYGLANMLRGMSDNWIGGSFADQRVNTNPGKYLIHIIEIVVANIIGTF
jgi:hypothetical protein